jgi:hypothetical protein
LVRVLATSASITPLNVPEVLKLLSASAIYVTEVDPAVDMSHITNVLKPLVSQLGSEVGSVALPTVMFKAIVDVS